MNSQLHCISAHPLNARARKICKIISGNVDVKLPNKLFSNYVSRYAELIYVEKKLNLNVTSGHYEMRLYKNRNKTIKSKKDLYCFAIHPMSMTFSANNLNSDKHPFTFICSSNGVSVSFSVHTKYELNGWMSVLQQLQWQYQPAVGIKSDHDEEQLNIEVSTNSNITPSNSILGNDDINCGIYNDDDDDDIRFVEEDIIVKQNNLTTDQSKRCTILGLLNDSY